MRSRFAWLLTAVLVVFCAVLLAIALYYRSQAPSNTADLLRYLPPSSTEVNWYIDVGVLRRAGVLDSLAGPAVGEEPDYRAFVQSTGFDYRRDLDAVIASSQGKDLFFLLRGRFDWKKLRDYATSQGGECRNGICRVPSNKPDRTVSFIEVKKNLMALAVSSDRYAARKATSKHERRAMPIPSQPIWAAAPGSALKGVDSLPAGTKLFAQAIENAERFTLAVGPEGPAYAALLDVTCRTDEEAVVLKYQFEKVTEVLRKLIARSDQAPNPRDLSGVLTSGTFHREDRRVHARWPIEKPFLDALAAGGNP